MAHAPPTSSVGHHYPSVASPNAPIMYMPAQTPPMPRAGSIANQNRMLYSPRTPFTPNSMSYPFTPAPPMAGSAHQNNMPYSPFSFMSTSYKIGPADTSRIDMVLLRSDSGTSSTRSVRRMRETWVALRPPFPGPPVELAHLQTQRHLKSLLLVSVGRPPDPQADQVHHQLTMALRFPLWRRAACKKEGHNSRTCPEKL